MLSGDSGCGKPMIAWSIEAAIKSNCFDRIVCSTDDEKIRKASIKYGAEVPFLRPKKLSTNNAKAVSADIHALKWAEKNEGCKFDFFVELMATNPLKTYKDIDNVLKKLIKKFFVISKKNLPIKPVLILASESDKFKIQIPKGIYSRYPL